ncbi:MAG: hypothetical protein ABSH51_27940 [Solirubrobacteraceae bacterium]|jgi:hypothetical protein
MTELEQSPTRLPGFRIHRQTNHVFETSGSGVKHAPAPEHAGDSFRTPTVVARRLSFGDDPQVRLEAGRRSG